MPAKRPRTDSDADLSLMSPIFRDEDAARDWLESKRWPNGAACPRCGCETAYKLTPKPGSDKPVRPGVYKCKGCRKQFTVRIGTIFEESRLPIHKWLAAIYLMCGSKKGISSRQLARTLDVTTKTAWFLSHRVREAMKQEPLAGMLGGTVEVDETYVGARKPRYKGTSKPGRGTSKQPVMVLVERDGNAAAMPVENVTGKALKGEVNKLVDKSATVVTDEWAAYNGIDKTHASHRVVTHRKKEYARVDEDGVLASTNTAGSFFALLKRSHYGTHHQMSKKHLHRYVAERAFMWNGRKKADGERLADAVRGAEGKRLRYRDPS